MVERIEAFKADDGSLYETENDAKLCNLIEVICKSSSPDLRYALTRAVNLHRYNIIEQIQKDWC